MAKNLNTFFSILLGIVIFLFFAAFVLGIIGVLIWSAAVSFSLGEYTVSALMIALLICVISLIGYFVTLGFIDE